MSARLLASACRSMLLTVAFALAFASPGVGADMQAPGTITVQIFPVHYSAGGRRFDDLAALETWLRSMPVRAVSLQLCGRQPLARLIAALERIKPVYPEDIRVSAFARADVECTLAGTALQGDLAYFASDKHGRSTLP